MLAAAADGTSPVARLVRAVLRYTPISGWTLLLAVGGAVLSLVLFRPVSRWTGWGPLATLVSALLVTGVLALTLGPGRAQGPRGVRSCVRQAQAQVDTEVYRIATSAEALLNLVFLVPLGLALVLATRRVWLATLLVLLLPGAIEVTQTRIPGRVCSGIDYLTNVTGGIAGVLVGALLLVVGWVVRRIRA